MRELKFRVMYKNYSGTLVKNEYILSDLIEMDGDGFLDDNDIVEQFTGLKDKNGEEIYEGDIVRYKLYEDSRLNYTDEVFYRTTSGAFMVGDEDNLYTLNCLVDIEVIGNIHENPELLG